MSERLPSKKSGLADRKPKEETLRKGKHVGGNVGKSKKNPDDIHVRRTFCDERFSRIWDKLVTIDGKVDKLANKEEEKGRDWRLLGFSILGSILSGITVSYIILACT